MRACFCVGRAVPHYLSEAYVAGVFGRIWEDDRGERCGVRIVPEEKNFPDAQLKFEDVCVNLEITMALDKHRKMFDDWREERAKAQRGEVILAKSADARRAIAREAIPRVVAKKAAKQYAVPPSLLVYTDDGRLLSANELARLTEPWADHFEAIYLLCGIDVVYAWPPRVMRGKRPL